MTSRPETHPSRMSRPEPFRPEPTGVTSLPAPRLDELAHDVAEHRVVVAHVDGTRYALLGCDDLRDLLAAGTTTRPSVCHDDGLWTVVLPGTPVAGEGETLDEAVDEVIEALRDYADDWRRRLHAAPRHADQWRLAHLVGLSTNRALRRWLTGV